jgi:hypothetical protein
LRSAAVALLLGAIVAVHLVLLFTNARDLCDDAMISARYARNLALGHGLVYNLAPAGARPVEGYSNFLWLVGMAAGEKLGLPVRQTTAGMGFFFSVVSIIALFGWVRRETRSLAAGVVSALALASWPAWSLWAVQGLETPMFAAFALLALSRRPGRAACFFALLASLTRPEGALVAFAVLAAHLRSRPGQIKAAAKSFAWFLLPFSLYTAFRLIYFGSLFPNTFYAKTGLGLPGAMVGVRYLFSFATANWPEALLLLAGLAAGIAKWRDRASPLSAFVLSAVPYLIFIVWAGGDFMPNHRFLMHLAPLMAGAGAIGITVLGKGKKGLVTALVLLLAASAWNGLAFRSYLKGDSPAKDWRRNQALWYGPVASWLLDRAERGATVAAGDIGYLGYVTGIDRVIDTNGLIDPHLARLPGAAGFATDAGYVLDQKPGYVIVMVHSYDGGAMVGHSGFDRAVLAGDRLGREYTLAAEIMGFKSLEKSLSDGGLRRSAVKFRIYRRKD